MIPQWIIEKKRDGEALDEADIRAFIGGYADGSIPDYQMAAFAMAVFFRGMTDDELSVLTDAMMRSGELIDTSGLDLPTADKHSTGGVGDKVSLVLAPLVACCDVAVPMMSGRGLGITGGTLDKLESIPGYRTNLSTDEFLAVLRDCGCAIVGQTAGLVPADRKLYALRDVTGTVPSIPLIAASIMSKKLAEGAGALVLDVKWGRGAFMKTREDARTLATTMVAIGQRMQRAMTAVLTDMNQPLGRTAGNALEVIETVETLRGDGPADLVDVTLELASYMLTLTGRAVDNNDARRQLQAALDSGAALERFGRMVRAQGGDASFIDRPELLPSAPLRIEVPAPGDGYVACADAEQLGRSCVALGAGRTQVEDAVDPAVGLSAIRHVGEYVSRDEPLACIHARDRGAADAVLPRVRGAFRIVQKPPSAEPLIGDRLT